MKTITRSSNEAKAVNVEFVKAEVDVNGVRTWSGACDGCRY